MVLLYHIIQIFHLADDDRRAVCLVVAPERRGFRLTSIDGDRLGRAMTADGLGEEARGGPLVAQLREQGIYGLSSLVDGAMAR
jgi:hypothetical protein